MVFEKIPMVSGDFEKFLWFFIPMFFSPGEIHCIKPPQDSAQISTNLHKYSHSSSQFS